MKLKNEQILGLLIWSSIIFSSSFAAKNISIPNFENITLTKKVEPKSGKTIFYTKLNAEKINQISNLDSNFIKFKDLDLSFMNNKLSIDAEAQILNKRSKLKLVDKIEDKAIFDVRFDSKLSLKIFPDRGIKISKAKLILEKDIDPKLIVKTNFLNGPVAIEILLHKKDFVVQTKISKARLTELDPHFKGTRFENILLTNILIFTHFSPNYVKTAISANTDFSSLNLKHLNKKLKHPKAMISINKDHEFKLECSIKNLFLPELQSIDNAQLTLALQGPGQKPKLKLTGFGTLDAKDFGIKSTEILKYNLLANYSPKRDQFNFKGKISDTINYNNNIKIVDPIFYADLDRSIIKITGKSIVNGFDSIISLYNKKYSDGKKWKNSEIKIKQNKWQPFKNSKKDLLKNIIIDNLKAKFSNSDSNSNGVIFYGQSKILNSKVNISAKCIQDKQQNKGTILKAKLPKNWDLSKSFPKFNGSFIKDLRFKDVYFMANDISFYDKKRSILLTKGLSLIGTTSLENSALKNIKDLVFLDNQDIQIFGKLDKDSEKIMLLAPLSSSLPINSDLVSCGPVSLEISGRPSMNLNSSLVVHPDSEIHNSTALNFSGQFFMHDESANYKGATFDTWRSPFNISGIKINNLLIDLEFEYFKFLNEKTFSKFSMTGNLSLGGHDIKLKSKINKTTKITESIKNKSIKNKNIKNIENITMFGNVDQFSLHDIVNFIANPMGANIPTTNLPNLILEDVQISISHEGLKLSGDFKIMGQTIRLNFEISKNGVYSEAHLPNISLESLDISNKKVKGPKIKVAVNKSSQNITIEGDIKIDDLTSKTNKLNIVYGGITFKFNSTLANSKFKAHIAGESFKGSLNDPTFKVSVVMGKEFIEFAESAMLKELKKLENSIKNRINTAQKSIRYLNQEIKKADTPQSRQNLKKLQNLNRKTLKSYSKSKFITVGNNNKLSVNLTEQFKLNSAKFSGKVKSIKNGKLPKMVFDISLLNQNEKVTLNFDFNNIEKSINELTKEVNDLVNI